MWWADQKKCLGAAQRKVSVGILVFAHITDKVRSQREKSRYWSVLLKVEKVITDLGLDCKWVVMIISGGTHCASRTALYDSPLLPQGIAGDIGMDGSGPMDTLHSVAPSWASPNRLPDHVDTAEPDIHSDECIDPILQGKLGALILSWCRADTIADTGIENTIKRQCSLFTHESFMHSCLSFHINIVNRAARSSEVIGIPHGPGLENGHGRILISTRYSLFDIEKL